MFFIFIVLHEDERVLRLSSKAFTQVAKNIGFRESKFSKMLRQNDFEDGMKYFFVALNSAATIFKFY